MPGSFVYVEGLPGGNPHVELEILRNDGNPYATLLSHLDRRFEGLNRFWIQFKYYRDGAPIGCGDDAALRNALNSQHDGPLRLFAKIPLNASVTVRRLATPCSELQGAGAVDSPGRSSESSTDSDSDDMVRLSQIAGTWGALSPPPEGSEGHSATQPGPSAPSFSSTAADDQAHAVAVSVVDVGQAIAGRYPSFGSDIHLSSSYEGGALTVVLSALDEVRIRDAVCGGVGASVPSWVNPAVVRGSGESISLDASRLLCDLLPSRTGAEVGLMMALASCGAWLVGVDDGQLRALAIDGLRGPGLMMTSLATRAVAVITFFTIGDDEDPPADADMVALLQGCGAARAVPRMRREAVTQGVLLHVAEGLVRPLSATLALPAAHRDKVLGGMFSGSSMCVGVMFCSVVRALEWCGFDMSFQIGGGGWCLSACLADVAAACPHGLLALQLLSACVVNATRIIASKCEARSSVVAGVQRAALLASLPLAAELNAAGSRAVLVPTPLAGVCDAVAGGGWVEATVGGGSDATVVCDVLEMTDALAGGEEVEDEVRGCARAIGDAVRGLLGRRDDDVAALTGTSHPVERAVLEVSIRRRRADVAEVLLPCPLTTHATPAEQHTVVPSASPTPSCSQSFTCDPVESGAVEPASTASSCGGGPVTTFVAHVQHSVSGRFIDDSPPLSVCSAVQRGALVRKPRSSTRWLVHVVEPDANVVVLQSLRSTVLAVDSDGRIVLRPLHGSFLAADDEARFVMRYVGGLKRRAGGTGVYVGSPPPPYTDDPFCLQHIASGMHLSSLDDGGAALTMSESVSDRSLWQFAALSSFQLQGDSRVCAERVGREGSADVTATTGVNAPPPPSATTPLPPSDADVPSRDVLWEARYGLNDVQLDAFKHLWELRGGAAEGMADDERNALEDESVADVLSIAKSCACV